MPVELFVGSKRVGRLPRQRRRLHWWALRRRSWTLERRTGWVGGRKGRKTGRAKSPPGV